MAFGKGSKLWKQAADSTDELREIFREKNSEIPNNFN
jgi:hypothetical protein